jgi:inorganic pyrophosphatase
VQTKPDLTSFLGMRVTVHIDRPLGSRHPLHADILYPVNFGYVPGTISGDDMPIDVYVLGIDEPLIEAEGEVIALVVRSDDIEDKLVVSAGSQAFTAEEIESAVFFQERYFRSRILTGHEVGG